MKKRTNFLSVFLVFLVLAALIHVFIHLAFYGTGYKGFAEKGITGLAVDGSEASAGLPISEVTLFLEWGLIFLGIIFVYAKHKIDVKKEYDYLALLKQKKPFSGGTELDRFYDLLKETKHFRLATAAKVFSVEVEIIEGWAKSLESSKVAELTYPRIGGPEVHLVEDVKVADEPDEGVEENQ